MVAVPRHRARARRVTWLVALLAASLTLIWVWPPTTWLGDHVAGATPRSVPAVSAPAGGPAVDLLGLGDSVVAGAHCDCTDYVTGLAPLLARRNHRAVDAVEDGVSGSNSADLLDDLQHDSGVRAEVRRADIVVVTIGANDLAPSLDQWRDSDCDAGCYQPGIDAMGDRVHQIVQAIAGLQGSRPGTVLVTNYWNVFTDGDVARAAEDDGYLEWSDAVTRAANTAICRAATTSGARCVDLYAPFKGNGGQNPTKLLADDGDHPNPAGTALISRTVLAALDS